MRRFDNRPVTTEQCYEGNLQNGHLPVFNMHPFAEYCLVLVEKGDRDSALHDVRYQALYLGNAAANHLINPGAHSPKCHLVLRADTKRNPPTLKDVRTTIKARFPFENHP